MRWHLLTILLTVFLVVFETAPAHPQNEIVEAVTPLRLSLVDGSVSFIYQHTGVRNAVVAIDREQFGRKTAPLFLLMRIFPKLCFQL
jgi:hypothetical protein